MVIIRIVRDETLEVEPGRLLTPDELGQCDSTFPGTINQGVLGVAIRETGVVNQLDQHPLKPHQGCGKSEYEHKTPGIEMGHGGLRDFIDKEMDPEADYHGASHGVADADEIRERGIPQYAGIGPEQADEDHADENVDQHHVQQWTEVSLKRGTPVERPINKQTREENYQAVQSKNTPVRKSPLGEVPLK